MPGPHSPGAGKSAGDSFRQLEEGTNMKSLRTIAVAVALSALAACGGGASDEANNADANLALESENLDAGLNTTDVNTLNTDVNADLNAGATVNADVNAVDANAADTTANNAL